MPVDPQLQVMLDEAAARAAAAGLAGVAPGQLPPAMLRAGYRAAILAALGTDYVPAPLAEVRDTTVAGVPVRVYRPEGRDRLSDWARHPEAFQYVESAEQTFIVNTAHIVDVHEVSEP